MELDWREGVSRKLPETSQRRNAIASARMLPSDNAAVISFQYRGVFKRPGFLLFPVLPFKPFFPSSCSTATRYKFSNSIPANKTDAQSHHESSECKHDAAPFGCLSLFETIRVNSVRDVMVVTRTGSAYEPHSQAQRHLLGRVKARRAKKRWRLSNYGG